jgi:prolyl-tRNA synthetase
MTEDGSYAAHEDVVKFKRNPANADAEMLPFQIIDQPEWVQTMDDNVKHYKKEKNHFLKNVVYKNRITGEIIIATVTGDLDVSQAKLEHVLNVVGQLEPATDDDLVSLGTKHGYVHSWGHKNARYIGDIVLQDARNLIGGQKEETTDSINVNYGRDFTCELLADIAVATAGNLTENGKLLIEGRGIEVGNTFQLGYHYTHLMEGAVYRDEDGKEKPYYMGCYGIGVGRTMAAVVERFNDEKGIVWPESVAPFQVNLLLVGEADEKLEKYADEVYEKLNTSGIDVLYDDRKKVSPGEKFSDADLIGIPWRVVVSGKTMAMEKIEIKKRSEQKAELIDVKDFLRIINK